MSMLKSMRSRLGKISASRRRVFSRVQHWLVSLFIKSQSCVEVPWKCGLYRWECGNYSRLNFLTVLTTVRVYFLGVVRRQERSESLLVQCRMMHRVAGRTHSSDCPFSARMTEHTFISASVSPWTLIRCDWTQRICRHIRSDDARQLAADMLSAVRALKEDEEQIKQAYLDKNNRASANTISAGFLYVRTSATGAWQTLYVSIPNESCSRVASKTSIAAGGPPRPKQ